MKFNYNSIVYILVVLGSMLSTSCRDYVEVDQHHTRTLKTTDDYRYLLNNKTNFESSFVLPLITSDNIAPEVATSASTSWGDIYQRAFVWGDYFYADGQTDIGWSNLYKQIYVANEILAGVMDSQNGTEAQKLSVAAEARVHRAFAYFALANQYAPVYDPAKAETQDGLPLLLTPDLFQDLNRVSLSRVYGQIIEDLETAIENLTDKPTFNHHPSKLAAYALLSRVYLTMRDFQEAGRYADMALSLNPHVHHLEDFVDQSLPRLIDDEEVILSKTSAGFIRGPINPELVALYDNEDLRLQLFLGLETNTLQGYEYLKPRANGNFYYNAYVGLSSPEIYLNRAEVYARANDIEKTVETLNALREKRFRTVDYQALTVSDIEQDPLQAVINERRREFVGTDIRWYDMRRLTLDDTYFKPIVRTFNGDTFTLNANSPRLVYPIDLDVLRFNPEIGQNPR